MPRFKGVHSFPIKTPYLNALYLTLFVSSAVTTALFPTTILTLKTLMPFSIKLTLVDCIKLTVFVAAVISLAVSVGLILQYHQMVKLTLVECTDGSALIHSGNTTTVLRPRSPNSLTETEEKWRERENWAEEVSDRLNLNRVPRSAPSRPATLPLEDTPYPIRRQLSFRESDEESFAQAQSQLNTSTRSGLTYHFHISLCMFIYYH